MTLRSSIVRGITTKMQMHFSDILPIFQTILWQKIMCYQFTSWVKQQPKYSATLYSVTTEQPNWLTERTIPDLCTTTAEGWWDGGSPLEGCFRKSNPSFSMTQEKNKKFQLLLQQWNQLYIWEGLLFRHYEDCGHLEEDKTLSRLYKRFYWPGHTKDNHM